jgi:hypothetical protein
VKKNGDTGGMYPFVPRAVIQSVSFCVVRASASCGHAASQCICPSYHVPSLTWAVVINVDGIK